ncbi:hypothetical protein [Phaeovulum sp.]|uniref:hypothetical protein n=1 Tax=Phaeovulum sp. TaxID=2934796 RepID=UPI0039E6DCB1
MPRKISEHRRFSLSPLLLNILVAGAIMALHSATFLARSMAAFVGKTGTVAVFGGAVFALTLLIITVFAVRWLQNRCWCFC